MNLTFNLRKWSKVSSLSTLSPLERTSKYKNEIIREFVKEYMYRSTKFHSP
jgi:hypothetical protein